MMQPSEPPPPSVAEDPAARRYWPEEDYLVGDGDAPRPHDPDFFSRAVRRTVLCLARWASHYKAAPCFQQEQRREGALPGDVRLRIEALGSLLDWLEVLPDPFPAARLELYSGDRLLLQGGDGIRGAPLLLTPAEFVALQDCWTDVGLPRDLYFAEGEERIVVEPVSAFGGVMWKSQRYTPRRAVRRDPAAGPPLRVPSEAERVGAFVDATRRYRTALQLRIAELMEPGRERDGRMLADLIALNSALRRLILSLEESR